ncbi:AAA family ATPase [Salmonella enterica]|nr:AAA family ATPase [Salmonella enterica]
MPRTKSGCHLEDNNSVTGAEASAEVIDLLAVHRARLDSMTDAEILADMNAAARRTESPEHAARLAEMSANAPEGGEYMNRPPMAFGAWEKGQTPKSWLSLTTDAGINWKGASMGVPERLEEQLHHANGVRRHVDEHGNVSAALFALRVRDCSAVLEQVDVCFKGLRAVTVDFLDKKQRRHVLIAVPHSPMPLEASERFAEHLRDNWMRYYIASGEKAEWLAALDAPEAWQPLHRVEHVDSYNGGTLDGIATAALWGIRVAQPEPDYAGAGGGTSGAIDCPDEGEPIVEGMINVGDYGVIFSPPNTGKTTFGVYLGFCLTNGVKVFNHMRALTSHVFYVDLEHNAIEEMFEASEEFHGSAQEARRRFHLLHGAPDMGNDASIDSWCAERLLEANCEPIGLVIIDTQRKAAQMSTRAGQPLKENDNDNMTVIANGLMRIARRLNAAAFTLHHTTKAGESMAGGGALEGGITSAFLLEVPDASKPNLLNITATKRRGNGMPKGVSFGLEMVDVRIRTEEEEREMREAADLRFAGCRKSAGNKAATHDQPSARFDVGPQTHAKTFLPGLFEGFDVVKQKTKQLNEGRKAEKTERLDHVLEFIRENGETLAADLVSAELVSNLRTAQKYLATLQTHSKIEALESAPGKAKKYVVKN